jgi:hypothetical protein
MTARGRSTFSPSSKRWQREHCNKNSILPSEILKSFFYSTICLFLEGWEVKQAAFQKCCNGFLTPFTLLTGAIL